MRRKSKEKEALRLAIANAKRQIALAESIVPSYDCTRKFQCDSCPAETRGWHCPNRK